VYIATMIALATAAFGVVAALAWNTAITDLIKAVWPGKGATVISDFIYAIIITIIAVIVIVNLGNLAQRASGDAVK